MKKDIQVMYDKEEDMFSLFRNKSNVKFSRSIELPKGDIILYFDFGGKIVGLEFFNASFYFPILKEIDATKNQGKNEHPIRQ